MFKITKPLIIALVAVLIYTFFMVVLTGYADEPQLHFGDQLIRENREMDKIYSLAKAISKCEGFGKKGTISTRNNNPGNLKIGLPNDNWGHTRFKTTIAGWNALHYLLMTRYAGKTPFQMNKMGYARNPYWYKCVNYYL